MLKPVGYILNYLPRRHVSNYENKGMDYRQFVGTFVIYFVTKCYIPGLIGTSVTVARCRASTNIALLPYELGAAVAQLVEALRYKSEGRGFDSRWCHWNFSLT